jgi:antirestriction protein ArdC
MTNRKTDIHQEITDRIVKHIENGANDYPFADMEFV